MPDTPSNADNGQQTRGEWLSVATVAARLGVSERAIQKRCASGTLPARRVPGARGEVWEVEALTANTNANLSANPNTVRRQVRAQLSLPVTNESERRINQGELESERERELKDEVRFLRGIIEQLQRDGAETRQHLKRALELAPKQLSAPSPVHPDEGARNTPQRPQNSAANNVPDTMPNAHKSAPLTYADIADQLERELIE
jgi:hypothetical protein